MNANDMEKTIEIPEGYEARIEGNKVILERKESEDERIRTRLIALVEAFGQGTYKDEMLAYLERQKEQQPAEWSEEDERRLNTCISVLEEKREGRSGYPVYMSEIDWLKSLRPKAKGEIYKSAKHDLAIRFMNYLDENRPAGKRSLSNGECEDIDRAFKENDWAKILRYVEKYSPSWKPSEEQIYSLGTVVNGYDNCTVGSVGYNLKELYEQLKKLM